VGIGGDLLLWSTTTVFFFFAAIVFRALEMSLLGVVCWHTLFSPDQGMPPLNAAVSRIRTDELGNVILQRCKSGIESRVIEV
jgi:hypothetical protein